MRLRFPRRPGSVPPTAGEDGGRADADRLPDADRIPDADRVPDERADADRLPDERTDADRLADPPEHEDHVRRAKGPPLEPPVVPPAPVVVPRLVQLVVVALAVLGLWALARATGTVLLILFGASTIALILNPLVRLLHRRGVPRGLAILLIYLAGFAFIGGVGVLLSQPVSTQVSHLERNVPQYIDKANRDLASLQKLA